MEVAVACLDALHLAFAEVVAALHEQVLAVRIGQRTGGVQANAAAVAVVGDAAVDVCAADQEVGGVTLVGVHQADLGLRAVVLELAAVAGGNGGLVTIHFRILGQVVDHATGAADAFGSRRAVDDFDTTNHAHVGEGAVAAAFAQRRTL